MDDDRIERGLRHGPPDTPRFEPSGRWLDAAQAADVTAERRSGPGLRPFAALAAVAAVIVLAVAIVGPLAQVREQGVGGLIGEVERRGALRMALDGGPPQAFTTSSGYEGFDVDVAMELATRLDVRLDPVIVPRSEILAGESGGSWDVAISSVPDALELGSSALVTRPYAVVDGAVAIRADDPASTLDDLAGSMVCVVAGSTAEAWTGGSVRAETGLLASPPAGLEVMVQSTAQECVAAVVAGTARAAAVDRRTDVSTGGGVRLLSEPPFESRLVAVVDADEDGAATLVARLNQLFAAMAADGTIRDIGQRRLGGADVTPPGD